MGTRLSTDIIGVSLMAIAVVSHLAMPDIPFIGKRPVPPKKVDLSEIHWDDEDTERLLTRVDAEVDL